MVKRLKKNHTIKSLFKAQTFFFFLNRVLECFKVFLTAVSFIGRVPFISYSLDICVCYGLAITVSLGNVVLFLKSMKKCFFL